MRNPSRSYAVPWSRNHDDTKKTTFHLSWFRGFVPTLWTCGAFSERKGQQRIVNAGASCHDDKLPTRTCSVRHGVRRIRVLNLRPPDLAAALRVERVKISVAAADEHEAGLRREGAAATVWRSEPIGQLDAFEQRVVSDGRAAFAERHLPGEVAF